MNRRKALGALGALFAVSACPDLAFAAKAAKKKNICVPDPDAEKLATFLNQPNYDADMLLPSIYRASQYTCVGDTNHSDVAILLAFYSERNIRRMHLAGKKHVCIEDDSVDQKLCTALLDKTTGDAASRRAKFVAEMNDGYVWLSKKEGTQLAGAIADAIILMETLGMTLHCVDTYETDSTPDEEAAFAKTTESLADYYRRLCPNHPGITHEAIDQYDADHKRPRDKKLEALAEADDQKRDDDSLRVRRIQDACGDEPAVIVFGAGHFDNATPQGMRAGLGADKCTYIAFYPNAERYADRLEDPCIADFVYLCKTDRVYQLKTRLLPRPGLARPVYLDPSRR